MRLPLIGQDELDLVQSISNVVRRGRVTAIKAISDGGVAISFKDSTLDLAPTGDGVVCVHCASPGPFNDCEEDKIFVSDTELQLNQIVVPPVCQSSFLLATIETARRQGQLDLEFA